VIFISLTHALISVFFENFLVLELFEVAYSARNRIQLAHDFRDMTQRKI